MCSAHREYAGRGGQHHEALKWTTTGANSAAWKDPWWSPNWSRITVTAASLSQETRNRWCRNAVAQNFTATITVKSSKAEMWDAVWRTKSGKGNVRHLSRHVASQTSVRGETKISEGPVGRLDNRNTIVKGKKRLPPSQIVTHFQRD